MLKRVLVLVLALTLVAPVTAFAAAGSKSQNTTTQTTSTSTSTSRTTSTFNTNVGNINMGYTITGYSTNTASGASSSFGFSHLGNYASNLELLTQGPSGYSDSGSYYNATHPAEAMVSYGGRGHVVNEGPMQYMGTTNLGAVSADRLSRTDYSTQVSTQVTANAQTITIGDFVLGTNTAVNTNTNTNTNSEAVYEHLFGNKVADVYQVNSSAWVSPIVLDLSHTGKLDASGGNWLPHRGLKGNRIAMFDIRGNGMQMMMEWVGPKAGLLVEPKLDGTVDGTCLFGDAQGYDNGFQKMALRDRNGDGRLTSRELRDLMVWVDANGNGRIDKNELRSLESLKITEISVRHEKLRGTFVMNGKTETLWDWWPTALDVRKVARK